MSLIWGYIYTLFFKSFPQAFSLKFLRKIYTNNFKCRLLAFGESYYRWPAIGPEWCFSNITNSDLKCEITPGRQFPVESNSVEIIYSAHLIEHLTPGELEFFVSECARMLKPGGGVRFEAPDAEQIVDSYMRKGTLYHQFYEDLQRHVVNAGYGKDYDHPHLGTVGVLSCYADKDNRCIPVIVSEEQFNEKIKLPLDKLDRWLSTLQTPEQKKTHGHNTLIYHQKMFDLFSRFGNFDFYQGSYGYTKIPGLSLNNMSRRHKDNIVEAPYRASYSLYFEAIRRG